MLHRFEQIECDGLHAGRFKGEVVETEKFIDRAMCDVFQGITFNTDSKRNAFSVSFARFCLLP